MSQILRELKSAVQFRIEEAIEELGIDVEPDVIRYLTDAVYDEVLRVIEDYEGGESE